MRTKIIYLSLALFLLCTSVFAQYGQNDWAPREHQIHFGFGPAFIYADNGGVYRQFDCSINPAFSLAYAKKLNSRFKFRATSGFQFLSSSNNLSQDKALEWGEEDHAYSFTGNAIYLDVMPEFYLFPSDRHMERNRFNFFAGLGIGYLLVKRDQIIARTENNQESEEKDSALYIPFRIGGFFAPAPHWDIGVEGNILTSFSDQLDGNSDHNRANDILFQIQFTVRRYLSAVPFWKKNL